VQETLGFPCRHGFFPAALSGFSDGNCGEALYDATNLFHAVTLWYVIEHFEDTGKILCEINRLLKIGGVLAFSTPSFSGISGRKSLLSFLKNSPPDHFTVWRPASCKRVLRRYGFRLKKIVVTGHHPERFPFFGRFVKPDKNDKLCPKNTLVYRFFFLVSKIFRLGDTFEAYGVKVS
jgi:SAM-dependent methyltransferase